MLWKKFNDQLAVLFIILIVLVWIADMLSRVYLKVGIGEAIIGATIVIFTLIAQHYFRRREPEKEEQK